MTQAHPQTLPGIPHDNRWPTALASLAVGAAFFALWFWLLPRWLAFNVDIAGTARWRCLAALPSVLGFAIALRCVWDFGWTGRGTPAPVAPPQRLVVVGPYRYVRNPMYCAVVLFATAEVLAYRDPWKIACWIVLALVLFAKALLEERALRALFPGYEAYARRVRRFIPGMF